jgi:hypothetical protein
VDENSFNYGNYVNSKATKISQSFEKILLLGLVEKWAGGAGTRCLNLRGLAVPSSLKCNRPGQTNCPGRSQSSLYRRRSAGQTIVRTVLPSV